MDIGKEDKPIIIEPAKSPVPERAPAPRREPIRRKEPNRPAVRPEKVPSKT